MALLKCKMCGGDLEIAPGVTVAECEYCGTQQTLPKSGSELAQNLFNRANGLRLKCEFDKAERIYEKILQENESEAEAHWGIVLCKYGIEYVEDPRTMNRIPTCHRTSYDAVIADADYLAALEYADARQRSIYEAEARKIDEIQKNILQIVKNEKPFDVFICYKETDENGRRTPDSAIANDIYYQLTQEGLKVFYAAITLEDKLGQAYEPYIFAALNSAKVMLVIGTMPHYFTSVWVKNEWSRFLKLMKTDRSKLLIPCYKDMDAYELPEEFAHLQAQDMTKIGFINDIVRGIRKVAGKEMPVAVESASINQSVSTNIAPLLKRAYMFLEDGDWQRANEYCEKVLDMEPECGEAYMAKMLVDLKVKKPEDLASRIEPIDNNMHYQKAVRFGDDALMKTLDGYVAQIQKNQLNLSYNHASQMLDKARTLEECQRVKEQFELLEKAHYLDTPEKLEQQKKATYKCVVATAREKMSNKTQASYEEAKAILLDIQEWDDAKKLIAECDRHIQSQEPDHEQQQQQMREIDVGKKLNSLKQKAQALGLRELCAMRKMIRESGSKPTMEQRKVMNKMLWEARTTGDILMVFACAIFWVASLTALYLTTLPMNVGGIPFFLILVAVEWTIALIARKNGKIRSAEKIESEIAVLEALQ